MHAQVIGHSSTELWPSGCLGVSLSGPDAADPPAWLAELPGLGYSTIWLAGGALATLDPVQRVLAATHEIGVGTAVAPMSVHPADELVRRFRVLDEAYPDRLIIGTGDAGFGLAATERYLGELIPGVPRERTMLAALGPRKLALAARATAGALQLLVTPGQVAATRTVLGSDALLIVHQVAALAPDRARTREQIDATVGFLARLPGYAASLRRAGLSQAAIDGLGDELIDAVTAWGGADDIAARVTELRAAGADQIVLDASLGRDALAAIAEALDDTDQPSSVRIQNTS